MSYAASEETIPLPLIFPSRIILVWKSCNSVWSFPKGERNKITWANIDVFYHKEMNTLHRNTRSYSSGQFCFLCDCYPSEVKIVIGNLLLKVVRLGGWIWFLGGDSQSWRQSRPWGGHWHMMVEVSTLVLPHFPSPQICKWNWDEIMMLWQLSHVLHIVCQAECVHWSFCT